MAHEFIPGSFTAPLSVFAKFIGAINALTCECRMHIAPGEVRVFSVDPSNVGLIDVKMAVADLKGRAVLGIDVAALGCPIRRLAEIFSADDHAEVVVSWCHGKDSVRPYLDIEISGMKYRFETLDETAVLKDPKGFNPDLPARFTCDGAQFARAVSLCSVFSERCRIEVSRDGAVTMAGKGDRTQCRIPLSAGGNIIAAALYSLDYMKDLSRALDGYPLMVEMGTDHPIRISARMTPALTVSYALAPRIESDDTVAETGWL